MRRIRTTSKYERRRMACKLRDPIGKPTRMIVVVIATLVGRENQLLSEEVLLHVRIEVDLRIEIEIDHEIDHETDREIDREIDHAIDHEIGIEGKIYKSLLTDLILFVKKLSKRYIYYFVHMYHITYNFPCIIKR